jgi:uncharacterized protein YraI
MKRMHFTAAAVLGALLFAPGAKAADALLIDNVNLRTGPDVAYPPILVIPAYSAVEVYGCVDALRWCDVAWGEYRGWVSGAFLAVHYQDRRVRIVEIGPSIGFPIVAFSFATYWDTHYRDRPWYRERAHWARWDHRLRVWRDDDRFGGRRDDLDGDRRDGQRIDRDDDRRDRRVIDRDDDRRDTRRRIDRDDDRRIDREDGRRIERDDDRRDGQRIDRDDDRRDRRVIDRDDDRREGRRIDRDDDRRDGRALERDDDRRDGRRIEREDDRRDGRRLERDDDRRELQRIERRDDRPRLQRDGTSIERRVERDRRSNEPRRGAPNGNVDDREDDRRRSD